MQIENWKKASGRACLSISPLSNLQFAFFNSQFSMFRSPLKPFAAWIH
jgi:hypothetical protein